MKLYNLLKNITNRLGYFGKKALVLGVMGMVCSGLWGATRYWVGGTSGNWNTTTSWSTTKDGTSGASVPTTGDTVVINSETDTTVTLDIDVTIKGIVIYGQGDCTFTSSGKSFTADAMFVGSSNNYYRSNASNGSLMASIANGIVPDDHEGNLVIDGTTSVSIGTLDTSSWVETPTGKNNITINSGNTLSVTTKWETGINIPDDGNRNRTSLTNNGTISVAGTVSGKDYAGLIKDLVDNGATISATDIYIWTGSADNDWNTTGNWSAGSVPNDANAKVFIYSLMTPEISSGSFEIKELNLDSGATLSINGSLKINSDFSLSSSINTTSTGTLESTGALTVASAYSSSTINLKCDTLNVNHNLECNELTVTGTASLNSNLTAGKATFNNLDVTSGNLTFSDTVTVTNYSETATPTGDITFNGTSATFTNGATFGTSGTVTIAAANTLSADAGKSFIFNNSDIKGSVSTTGAGTQTYNGTTTLSGTISSVGNVTFDASASLEIQSITAKISGADITTPAIASSSVSNKITLESTTGKFTTGQIGADATDKIGTSTIGFDTVTFDSGSTALTVNSRKVFADNLKLLTTKAITVNSLIFDGDLRLDTSDAVTLNGGAGATAQISLGKLTFSANPSSISLSGKIEVTGNGNGIVIPDNGATPPAGVPVTLTADTILKTSGTSGPITLFDNTSGDYALTIDNSGTFTLKDVTSATDPADSSTAPTTALSVKSFTQSGAGTNSISGDISTTGNISFASPITLTGYFSCKSSGGTITFSNSISGSHLLITSATNVLFNEAVTPVSVSTTAFEVIDGNLEINRTNATDKISFTCPVTVKGNITITKGNAIFEDNVSTEGSFTNSAYCATETKNELHIKGNFTDSGTFTEDATNSKIVMEGDADQEFIPGTSTYKKIIVNKLDSPAAPATPTATGSITFKTNELKANYIELTNCNGATFSNTFYLKKITDSSTAGDISITESGIIKSDTTLLTSGKIKLASGKTLKVSDGSVAPATPTYYNFTHNYGTTEIAGTIECKALNLGSIDIAGDSTLTATGGVTFAGGATSAAKKTFTGAATHTLTINGNLTVNDFYDLGSSSTEAQTIKLNPATNTLTNNGTSDFYKITFTGDVTNFTSKTLEIKDNSTVNGSLTNNGSFTIASGKTFKLSNNFENNGTVTANGSTFELIDKNTDSEISGTTFAFNNFTASNLGGKTITLKSDITVNGSLSLSGTAPAAGATPAVPSYLTITDDGSGYGFILPNGSQPSTINGTAAGSYLSIGSTVKIKKPGSPSPTCDGITGTFYKASDSVPSGTFVDTDAGKAAKNAAYATVINNGWRIKELSDLTYTWVGGAAATDTDWATRTHWDIGIVPGITTTGATQSSGATVIISDGKTSYPELGTTAYTLSSLTIGTSGAATHDASLTLAGTADLTVTTKNNAGTTINGTLANYSQIIHSSSGRIIGASGAINDSAKGSVEYKTATGTIADVDYYDLIITSGEWSNTTDKSITINNTLSVTGSPTINIAEGLTCKGGDISIPSTATLTLGGTIKSISDGATPIEYTHEYNCPVTLSANADFQGSTITFKDTVNGGVIFKVSGNGVFEKDIGGTTAPASIEVTGTSNINTTAITSTGDQTYTGTVTIGEQNTAFTSSSGLVNFGSTLTGTPTVSGTPATTTYHNLTITGKGQFDGTVSNFEALSISGAATVNSNITTKTSTDFGNTTSLAANKTISSGTNTFTGDVTMGTESTITASSSNTFSAKVNMGDKSTITATTMSNFAANITATATNNTITLDTPVTITDDISLTAANVTFKNNISGAGKTLTLIANASFSGASEITTNILNKGTINVPAVADAGTPPAPQTAISFKGTYTANGSPVGSLVGSTSKDPYIDFYKDATFGTFTANDDTVRFMGTDDKNFNPNKQTFKTIIFDNGKTTIKDDFTTDNLTINTNGKVEATDSKTLTINENWTNNAGSTSFTANKSTVEFKTTADSNISGDTTFYNLKCEEKDKTLIFTGGSTQTVSNVLTIKGQDNHLITLKSSVAHTPSPTQWKIKCTKENTDASPSHSLSYVDIQDSNNISDYRLKADHSNDSENNTRWDFITETYTWTGASNPANSNWFDQNNWDQGSVPGIGVDVVIATVPTGKKYPVLEADLENAHTAYSSVGSSGKITVNSGAELDLATYGLTAGTIVNNGLIRLSGGQTITGATTGSRPSITNNTDSIVEYYGTLRGDGKAALSSTYAKLEFTSGATGTISEAITVNQTTLIANGTGNSLTLSGDNTFTGVVTIGQASPAVTGGALTINAASDLTIADAVTCDSLTASVTSGASGKTITLQGSLTTTGAASLTGKTVTTSGGASGAPKVLTVPGNLTINGIYSNTGYITNDAITQVNGTINNSNTYTANQNTSFTADFTDTGTWSSTKQIIFNGTGAQKFTSNPATTYADIYINKSSGTSEFTNNVNITTFTDVSTAGNITFKGYTTISNDVTFLTAGTVELGSATTNVTTLGLSAPYNKFTHTAGKTKLFGKLIAAEATFATVDCGSDITLDIAQVNLNGNVTSSASYIKLNGNLTTANTITVAPKLMLNGSFDGDGNATFNRDLHIFSPIATPAPVSIDTVTITGNLIIDSPCTITTSGNIKAGNIVLYRGDITSAADSTLEATNDIVLLGANYSISNPDSGNTQEFLYQQTRLSAANYNRANFDSTNTDADKMPDGTALSTVTSGFSGTYTAGPGATLKAGKNFYANGTTFNASANWFISLPDITNASDGFAETVRTSIVFSTIRCNADSSTDGSKARMPAYFCTDNGNNVNWIFDDFEITEVHTVRDDTLKITFNRPVRNVNSELIDSVARFVNSTDTYSGFYTDADCQNPLTAVNIASASIYLKSDNSWNTDATGTSSGNENATDRSGIHKTVTPYLEVRALVANSKIHISDIWGKRIRNYDGNKRFTAVTDQTGPVLYSVRTGQEFHTAYNKEKGASSQPSYDAHNFLEFRYSEQVNFGDTTLATGADINKAVFDNADLSKALWLPSAAVKITDNFPEIDNVRVRDSFGVLSNDITKSGNLKFTGLGNIASGLIYTGSQGSTDKYVNALYRTDEFSIRVSIAGYTEGTVTDRNSLVYKNWPGYIEQAIQPNGNVTMLETVNTMVTDCAIALDGTTPAYNPQEKYAANQVIPIVNQIYATKADYEEKTIYSNWDISSPVFTPLRLDPEGAWEPGEYYEAVGNTSGMGSTLDKIEFHLFDNTPAYSTNDKAAWLTEKGWIKNNLEKTYTLYDEKYSYTADIIGGARQFDADDTKRTEGGIRYSTIDSAAVAFKYIDSQAKSVVPNKPFDTSENGVFIGAKASLFIGSSTLRRAADAVDGLYFGLKLTDSDLPVSRSFTVSYDDSKGFITDLAGNRLRSATFKTIDRTPPSYDIFLSPLNQNELYMVFVKKLMITSDTVKYRDNNGNQIPITETFETLIPKCFEVFSLDSKGTPVISDTLQIDYSVPAKVEEIVSDANESEFTVIRLRLTGNTTLPAIENMYVRLKYADGYKEFSQDPITSINDSRVTFIQDSFGNYMPMYEAHSLSDFAISSINPLYAYDADMMYNGEIIMNNFYGDGTWAVHDWNEDQQNYGTLPADHPYAIVSDIITGTNNNDDLPAGVRIFLSNNPDPDSVSAQYNADLNQNLRVWLPEVTDGLLPAMALKNNPIENYFQTDSVILNEKESLSRIQFNIPKEVSQAWGPNQQVTFMFGFLNSDGTPLRIYNSPYYNVGTKTYDVSRDTPIPLYAIRLKDPSDITSLDLWSFKTRSITEQRGGVTILNNVINATIGEKTMVKVNMPSDGKLNVMVMTIDGNIITYLQHGQTEAGEHYYSWDGKNGNKGIVARGMYFIRVVGNGLDETRKVMVVK